MNKIESRTLAQLDKQVQHLGLYDTSSARPLVATTRSGRRPGPGRCRSAALAAVKACGYRRASPGRSPTSWSTRPPGQSTLNRGNPVTVSGSATISPTVIRAQGGMRVLKDHLHPGRIRSQGARVEIIRSVVWLRSEYALPLLGSINAAGSVRPSFCRSRSPRPDPASRAPQRERPINRLYRVQLLVQQPARIGKYFRSPSTEQ